MKLSIVVPAYNEENRLIPMLDSYTSFFVPRYGDDAEIIIVVNGSSDRTDEIAMEYHSRCPQVKVVIVPWMIGKGGAIMKGFAIADGDLIGFTDADGATPPEAFQDLADQIGDAGAIIASRWLPESVVEPPQPPTRRIASRIFNAQVRFLFGLKITDTQCGAKLLTREAVATILPELGLTRWAFDVDLLFQLRRAGFPIREIPTTWRDVKGSKINVPKASMEMTFAICRLRLLHSPFRWIVSVYNHTIAAVLRRIRGPRFQSPPQSQT